MTDTGSETAAPTTAAAATVKHRSTPSSGTKAKKPHTHHHRNQDAAAAPAAAAAPPAQQQQQQRGIVGTLFGFARQALFIYFLFFMGKKLFFPQTAPTTTSPDGSVKQVAPVPKITYHCFFNTGDPLVMRVYLSDKYNLTEEAEGNLTWTLKDLTYDSSSKNERTYNTTLEVPNSILATNSTIYAHIFVSKHTGKQVKLFRTINQMYLVYPLVQYLPRPETKEKKFLLSGTAVQEDSTQKSVPIGGYDTYDTPSTQYDTYEPTQEYGSSIIKSPGDPSGEPSITKEPTSDTQTSTPTPLFDPYWIPELNVRVVPDSHRIPPTAVPAQLLEHIQYDSENAQFWPVLFVHNYWLEKDQWIAINDTVSSLPLKFSFGTTSWSWFMFFVQMEQTMKMQMSLTGEAAEGMDEFKHILKNTNPYLLGVTFVVTILHTIFDFLAFKNDISFWRSRKSVAGISVKTLMLNTICQVIIFLYLLDNETSWMIIISCGIGLLIEFWKIGKAVKVSIHWYRNKIPFLKFSDRESYTQSNTKEYDDRAMRVLSYVLYPLVIAYAIYSLVYETHKSWYSWILASLTGTVYMFGFIMMTPQLFINYKLKSVAHLPWRALIYKALNTFIDDLFAFIIRMPTMHRVACFRDDVVFLVYVYQRWIYRVDTNRIESLQWEDASGMEDIRKTSPATTTTTTTAQETNNKQD
ncbi:Transmembrane CLPTM1 family protein [Pelomyxa schiedti]|nr:Transmembrane CLPTM1 family protein [Pelomyxa schiedti]